MPTMSPSRRTLLAWSAALLVLGVPRQGRAADKPAVFTGLVEGVGAGGYDVVSYHQGQPRPGDPGISAPWNGATWRFATEANRQAFLADPERYAPAFGGYCAWAVAEGYTAKGDPQVWHIENGRLFLNYNRAIGRRWARDIAGNISRGDANWPQVLSR